MHSKVASDDEAWGQSYGIAVLAGVFGVRAHRWGVQHSGNHVIAGVCVCILHLIMKYVRRFITSVFSTARSVLKWPFEALKKAVKFPFLTREPRREKMCQSSCEKDEVYFKKCLLYDD